MTSRNMAHDSRHRSRVRRGWILAVLAFAPGIALAEQPTEDVDREYQQLITQNRDDETLIREIDAAMEGDSEVDASFLAYYDSLEAHPALAEQESLLYRALDDDSVLAGDLGSLERTAASDSEAAQQLAVFDSLVAADPELARIMEEIEEAAGADSGLLETHGDAIAYLETHPQEAEEIFADEEAPSYAGPDSSVVVYVEYLVLHPRLYSAWWRLYAYARTHPRIARPLYAHWQWFGSRPRLWIAWWRYRLRAAQSERVRRIVWQRRVYLGRRPRLARGIWRHRLLLAGRPALRRHTAFLHRHPRIARGVLKHRRWVHKHRPPARKPPPRHPAKPGPKPGPKPPRRPPRP